MKWYGRALVCALFVSGLTAQANADKKADQLLVQVQAATQAVRSLSADVTLSQTVKGKTQTVTGALKIKRPGNTRIETNADGGQLTVSDGKIVSIYSCAQNQYSQIAAEGANASALSGGLLQASAFFDPSLASIKQLFPQPFRYAGSVTLNGTTYQTLENKLTANGTVLSMQLFIDPHNLITRTHVTVNGSQGKAQSDSILTNVQVNVDIPARTFAFIPPKNAQVRTAEGDDAATLLPVGKAAPRFVVPTPSGGKVSLATVLKGHRATLVNFWFYG